MAVYIARPDLVFAEPPTNPIVAVIAAVEQFDEGCEVDGLIAQCASDLDDHDPKLEGIQKRLLELGKALKQLIANYRRDIIDAIGHPDDWSDAD